MTSPIPIQPLVEKVEHRDSAFTVLNNNVLFNIILFQFGACIQGLDTTHILIEIDDIV